jgi:hypothetical protein
VSAALPVRVSEFSYGPMPGSIEIDGGPPRLAIAALQLEQAGETLRFALRLSYGLPQDFAVSFESIASAMVAVVREESTGRAAALRLSDPGANRLVPITRNFDDRRTNPPSSVFACGFVNATFEVSLQGPPPHPGLRVHVALQGLLSNSLVLLEAA